MLRNPELRRALLVGGLLTLLASAAAMSLSGWQAACVALALGTVLLVLYGVELCCRYRAMARLAADIDAVLHGSGDIHTAAAISIWPITARARSACCAARCAK